MISVLGEIEIVLNQFSALSEEELEIELGRRLKAIDMECSAQVELSAAQVSGPLADASEIQGSLDVLRRIAQRFLQRFSRELYSLICDSSDKDNTAIRSAFKDGSKSLGLVLAGVLLANFGWLPGIVAVVTAIIVQRFADSAYESVCDVWGLELAE